MAKEPLDLTSILVSGAAVAMLTGIGIYLAVHGGDHQRYALRVEPEALDLGQVWAQDDFPWILPVQNTSGRRVTIVDVEASSGRRHVEPLPLVLDGHATAELHFTLDLTSLGDFRTGEAQDVSIQLLPIIDGRGPAGATWHLEGTVRQPFAFDSPTLDLGEIVIGTQPVCRVFEAKCHVPIESVHAEYDPAAARMSVTSVAADGSSFQLAITPVVSEAPERVSFPVRVHAVTKRGERLPGIEVPVTGEVVPDLVAVPSMLTFGLLDKGETRQETVVVRSRTGRPLEISASADSPDLDLEINPAPTAPGAYLLEVGFEARQAGNHSSRIHILARYDSEEPWRFETVINTSCYVLE